MQANRNILDQLIESSGATETFNWSDAGETGLVGKFEGMQISDNGTSGRFRIDAPSEPVALTTPIAGVTHFGPTIQGSTSNMNIWWGTFQDAGGVTNVDFEDDDTRSLIFRLTIQSDVYVFIVPLAADLSNPPDPDSNYAFAAANGSQDVRAVLRGAWDFIVRAGGGAGLRENLTMNYTGFNRNLLDGGTLDFALVENSAGWQQSGSNVVRGAGGAASFSRAISGSELLASGLEGPGEGMMTASGDAAGTWGADVEVQIADAPFLKLDSISNSTPSKSVAVSLNAKYRVKLTSGSNVRVLLAA